MREKLAIALNTGKKKAVAIAFAAVLVLFIGIPTAFAASNLTSLQGTIDGNGERYSTDGGKTWIYEVPDGVTVSVGENGEHAISIGTLSKDANNDVNGSAAVTEDSVAVKQEDGNILYSTDGGQTWSENAPAGSGVIDAE